VGIIPTQIFRLLVRVRLVTGYVGFYLKELYIRLYVPGVTNVKVKNITHSLTRAGSSLRKLSHSGSSHGKLTEEAHSLRKLTNTNVSLFQLVEKPLSNEPWNPSLYTDR